MRDCDDGFFVRGEHVRLRLKPEVTGLVVNERDWGGEYEVSFGARKLWFADVELEAVPETDDDPEPKHEPEQAAASGAGVIDFLEARRRMQNAA